MTELQDNSAVPPVHQELEGTRWARAHHVLLGFLGVGFVIWILTGIYRIEISQIGLVERMGAWVTDANGQTTIQQMGLHYGLPWPLDIVHKFPISETHKLDVVTFGSPDLQTEEFKRMLSSQGMPKLALEAFFDPYLITSDKNNLNSKVQIKYHINKPELFFNSVAHTSIDQGSAGRTDLTILLAEREQVIKQVVDHELIREMSRINMEKVLTDKQDFQEHLRLGIQREIEALGLGVTIDALSVDISWPKAVDPAFIEALNAKAGMQQAIDRANSIANNTMIMAQERAKSSIMVDAAKDANGVLEQAKGEVGRFSSVYEKYQKHQDLTTTSIHTDALNSVIGNVGRVMYVQPGQKETIVIDPPIIDRSQPSK